MSDFCLTLPSHSSKNEFPSNASNHFKIRLPNPIRLEGQGWKVGLTSVSLPDPTSQLPPLMKGNEPMFVTNWLALDPGPNKTKDIKNAKFKPSDLRSEDLETLTGVSFMKTMKAFFSKERVSQSMESDFKFKEADGKKTYIDFKWDGDDFLIDNSDIHLQLIRGSFGVDYFPNVYVNAEFAIEMGWFKEVGEKTYTLGPNIMMEPPGDVMPVPLDSDAVNEEYSKVTPDGKNIRLTITCSWRFINLNSSFKNVTGRTQRSLFIYSDVGGSGVVGNQVTDLLREVNYKREDQGSQYFEPLHIQYIDVHKEMWDIIEVQVSETTGELVKFGAGNTIATLHFKKT